MLKTEVDVTPKELKEIVLLGGNFDDLLECFRVFD